MVIRKAFPAVLAIMTACSITAVMEGHTEQHRLMHNQWRCTCIHVYSRSLTDGCIKEVTVTQLSEDVLEVTVVCVDEDGNETTLVELFGMYHTQRSPWSLVTHPVSAFLFRKSPGAHVTRRRLTRPTSLCSLMILWCDLQGNKGKKTGACSSGKKQIIWHFKI